MRWTEISYKCNDEIKLSWKFAPNNWFTKKFWGLIRNGLAVEIDYIQILKNKEG